MTDDLLPITLGDMLAELRRELRLRQKVYPRLMQEGKLNRKAGERQLVVLTALIEKFEAMESQENEAGRKGE